MSEVLNKAFADVLKRPEELGATQPIPDAVPLPMNSAPDEAGEAWRERMERENPRKPKTIEEKLPDGSTRTLYLKSNGKYGPRGGMPKKQTKAFAEQARKNGEARQINLESPEERQALVSAAAAAIMDPKTRGVKGFLAAPGLQNITPTDRARVARLAGEEFNKQLSDKLAELTELTMDEIKRNLVEGNFKPGELAFNLQVLESRRALLDGRSALSNAQINLQVNNYGPGASKEDIIAALTNVTPQMPASAPQPVQDVDVDEEPKQ